MSLQIGKVIYNLLQSNTELGTKLQDKIFPLIANENTTFPFIVYKRTGIVPAYSKDRFTATETISVDVIVASDMYNDTVEIADLVRVALEGRKGMYWNIYIEDIRLLSADEEYMEDTFIQTLTFNINTNGKYNS